MKKIALFVLLFGAGLTVLLYYVRRDAPREPTPRPSTPEVPERFTSIPQPQDGVKIEGVFQGRFDHTVHEDFTLPDGTVEGRPLFTLHSDDLQPRSDGAYDAKNLVVDVHDPTTRKIRFHLTSPSTRIPIPLRDGKVSLGDGQRVELENVEMTIFEGAPIVPLTLSVPHLTWHMTEQHTVERIDSADRVQMNGQGFWAEGTGFEVDTADGTIELQHSGVVRLRLADGGEAQLTATGSGPIRVQRTQVGTQWRVELVTSEGAKLALRGAEPFELASRSLHVTGLEGGSGQSFVLQRVEATEDVVATSREHTFRARHAEFAFGPTNLPTRAVLDGDVVLESSGDVFGSQAAEFDFDERGRLAKALLSGAPTGTLQLGKYLPVQPAPGELERQLRTATAQLNGAGPLVIDLTRTTRIDLAGPGELRIPEIEFELRSQGALSGSISSDRRVGELSAGGGVVLTYAGARLDSDALDLRYAEVAAGQQAITALTRGPTTVKGTSPGGQPVTLTAHEGLEARAAHGRISIPVARRIRLQVEGERGFDARADLVKDLDWERREFIAEGAVQFSNAEGDGNAERAVVHGTQEVELFGTLAEPARWVLARRVGGRGPVEGEVSALELRSRQDQVHAAGRVIARLAAGIEEYQFEGDRFSLVLDPAADPARPQRRAFHAQVDGSVTARFSSPEDSGLVRGQHFRVDGFAEVPAEGAPKPEREADILAEGDVELELHGATEVRGTCERLTIDRRRRARLEAKPGERVSATADLGEGGLPYRLEAAWLDLDEEHVEGSEVVGGLAPEAGGARLPSELGAAVHELRSRRLWADKNRILLEGEALARGTTAKGEAWSVTAGTLRITGDFRREQPLTREDVHLFEAMGGFQAEFADRTRARGDTLTGTPERTRIEGAPAELLIPGATLTSNWIQYDAEKLLLATDKGTLLPDAVEGMEPWSVTYESLQPFARGESTLLALRNPHFKQGDTELRAGWTIFWVDQDEWARRSKDEFKSKVDEPELRTTIPEEETRRRKRPKTIAERFLDLRDHPITKVLSEVYIEGNPEITEGGKRRMRATSIYVDLKEGRGWIRDADVLLEAERRMRNLPQSYHASADWMSIGPDLTLRADKAVVTSCDYDDPHYVIETGDLRVKYQSERDYAITASDNALRFGDAIAMPLPVFYAGRESGYPFIADINLGDSARFGASMTTALNLPLGSLGKGIGGMFGEFLDLPEVEIPEGRWKLNAGILGTRGVLLGTGLEYIVKEDSDPDGRTIFHFDSTFDAIPDPQDDKGFVRVDPDDRPLVRNWLRIRSRWTPEEHRWWDLVLSRQSDPGVQSEFFEREYVSYEQKDTYLHYRSAWDDWYFNSSVKIQLEDRTDIEELPSVGLTRGRRKIADLGDLPLYHVSRLDAAYLIRQDGDPQYYAPFPDGLGDREVLRADLRQRLEVPIDTGFAAFRATPFVEGRATAWDRDVTEDDSPSRLAVLAGIEFGTTFWKRLDNGSMHALVPTLALRGDLVVDESGGMPVRFDTTEDPLEGRFAELGLRSRWWKPDNKERLDIELSTSYGTDLPPGADEGFQEIAVLAEFLTIAGEVPIGFTHDGRYDPETGFTKYSRTFVGCEPVHDVGIELGYHLGRDEADEVLYEAATLAARYRATHKWELEFDQSYSLADSSALGNSFTLRRLGHDFVMEVEVGYRAGEGASFNMSFKPLFAWKRSSLGLIDRWLGTYH